MSLAKSIHIINNNICEQELPLRASNELAVALLNTQGGRKDLSVRQQLTSWQWLPDVESQLQSESYVPDAGERGKALSRLLETAAHSRCSMTGVFSAY